MATLVFRALTRWTEYINVIVEAIERAVPGSQVYLTGGAVEGRLTVLSDIDIIVALEHRPSFNEAVDIRVKIMEEFDKAEIPPYLPLDIHIVGVDDLKRYRTLIPLNELRGKANS